MDWKIKDRSSSLNGGGAYGRRAGGRALAHFTALFALASMVFLFGANALAQSCIEGTNCLHQTKILVFEDLVVDQSDLDTNENAFRYNQTAYVNGEGKVTKRVITAAPIANGARFTNGWCYQASASGDSVIVHKQGEMTPTKYGNGGTEAFIDNFGGDTSIDHVVLLYADFNDAFSTPQGAGTYVNVVASEAIVLGNEIAITHTYATPQSFSTALARTPPFALCNASPTTYQASFVLPSQQEAGQLKSAEFDDGVDVTLEGERLGDYAPDLAQYVTELAAYQANPSSAPYPSTAPFGTLDSSKARTRSGGSDAYATSSHVGDYVDCSGEINGTDSSCAALVSRELDCSFDNCTCLVSYWKMNGDLDDSYGSNNATSNVNGNFINGTQGDALNFSGNGYATVGSSGLPSGSSPRTISLWFKLNSDSAGQFFNYGGNSANGRRFTVGYSATQVVVEVRNAAALSTSFTYDTNWHHMVAVFPDSGSTLGDAIIYLDGYEDSLTYIVPTMGVNTIASQATFGAVSGATSHARLDGALDEVTVFNCVLSRQEIVNLYLIGPNTSDSPSDCAAGIDGNADGNAGCADITCNGITGPGGFTCELVETSCQDGNDNDGDGLTDLCDPDCSPTNCADILASNPSAADGIYSLTTPGTCTSYDVYCDMTTDNVGWTLVAVALVGSSGVAGWNGESELNTNDTSDLNAHWHYSSDRINTLAENNEVRVACFDSSNNYIRYWWGVSNYQWGSVTSATETWDSYLKDGTQHATSWASHQYGLISGNNETWVINTAHSGNLWACGGSQAAGGEGFTGRGGIANFRMWVR